jgi:hypothetical protein
MNAVIGVIGYVAMAVLVCLVSVGTATDPSVCPSSNSEWGVVVR